MKRIRRYQLCGENSALVLSDDGNWIRFEEHEQVIEQLKKQIDDMISIVQGRGSSLSRQIIELIEALEEEKNGSET